MLRNDALQAKLAGVLKHLGADLACLWSLIWMPSGDLASSFGQLGALLTRVVVRADKGLLMGFPGRATMSRPIQLSGLFEPDDYGFTRPSMLSLTCDDTL